jgi:hypothetical protein
MKQYCHLMSVFFACVAVNICAAQADGPEWVRHARIAAYGLNSNSAAQIVQQAQASQVQGIEVDNDITGRYDSFVVPTAKLKTIRELARKAHQAGNHAFVYIAGTECITPDGDTAQHTLFKDHPDWVQRNMAGAPAIFHSGDAFWIHKGDEDAWVSPYAPEWRERYMKRVRQIAATGIDGIYVDIPYWMTHFKGWDKTWASFDDYTVAAFKRETGLDARKDMRLGDFADPNFRKWVEFRIQTMTDFLKEIDRNAKSVKPGIVTIPELYPGIEESTVRVGVDPYRIYPVVSAISHEYEVGEGDATAAARTPLDWFLYQTGVASFRAFAEGKATWILNYSWDGNTQVAPREAMLNLAMSEMMAGANVWDARGHVMNGSNDLSTRTELFAWIRKHEGTFYDPRSPIQPVGLYFSPATRDFFTDQFLPSYQGLMILLMQSHIEYQILTPRSLANFHGKTLVLPDIQVLDETEKASLKAFAAQGGQLIITGMDATGLGNAANIYRIPNCPGAAYMAALKRDFLHTDPSIEGSFLRNLETERKVVISASPSVATQIAMVDGQPHIFFANFHDLVSNQNAVQTPESKATITVKDSGADAVRTYFLPFLGEVTEIHGTTANGETTYVLPDIQKGAVVWFDPERH